MATHTKRLLGCFLTCLLCILVYFCAGTAAAEKGCDLPPTFWCDNKDIAERCGVYKQCRQHMWTLRENAPPVELVLYYESLCPDCKLFITKMLYPTYQSLSSIVNLTLVPYGNARETQEGDHWVFDCQHGEDECLGNLIATCTIAIVKDISKYFPFINCLEGSHMKPEEAAKTCASSFPVPLSQILNCTKSDMGNKLEHEMAVQTDALQPPHKYVPWVTLNGVHTEEIQQEAQQNLPKLLCDTYKGTKPPACNKKVKAPYML